MAEPKYSIGTWDTFRQAYTPQRGLSVPSFNCTLAQLRIAIRELRRIGYSCHRRRDGEGTYDDNDWAVIIERTDGKPWRDVMREWRR